MQLQIKALNIYDSVILQSTASSSSELMKLNPHNDAIKEVQTATFASYWIFI